MTLSHFLSLHQVKLSCQSTVKLALFRIASCTVCGRRAPGKRGYRQSTNRSLWIFPTRIPFSSVWTNIGASPALIVATCRCPPWSCPHPLLRPTTGIMGKDPLMALQFGLIPWTDGALEAASLTSPSPSYQRSASAAWRLLMTKQIRAL